MKSIHALILLVLISFSTAAKAFHVAPVVGVNFFSPKEELGGVANQNLGGRLGLGFGGLVDFSLFPGFQLQTGALLLNNNYQTLVVNVPNANFGISSLHIPVMVRFSGLPIVSFGAGLYYGMFMGNVSRTDPTSGALVSETTLEAAGISSSDLGGIVSVGLDFPLAVISLYVDGRYYFGLKNLYTAATTDTLKSSGVLVLAGLKFGF